MTHERSFDLPGLPDARRAVIRERDVGPDEYIVFDDYAVENRNVVLHSNAITEQPFDRAAFRNRAVFPDARLRTNVRVSPHPRTAADHRRRLSLDLAVDQRGRVQIKFTTFDKHYEMPPFSPAFRSQPWPTNAISGNPSTSPAA